MNGGLGRGGRGIIFLSRVSHGATIQAITPVTGHGFASNVYLTDNEDQLEILKIQQTDNVVHLDVEDFSEELLRQHSYAKEGT